MALTDIECRKAKPQDREFKLADAGGLYLLITPSGGKLWRLKFRVHGREKKLAIGGYPAVSLSQARDKRDAAKALLAQGGDPSQAKRDAKRESETASANTFRAIADEYVGKLRKEGRAKATLTKTEWMIGFANAEIGNLPIRNINSPKVLEVLKKIEARGRHETARRTRSTMSAVFRYAVATSRADGDPTEALRGALISPRVKHRAAVTEAHKLGALMRAIDDFEGQPTTIAALQLMAIVFPRPGELRMAEWSEFDMEQATWTIPAERAKMRRPHRSPLSTQALAILRALHSITGNGRLVFPSLRSATRPMSENTLNAALRRLGYAKDEATAHGFRASASTLLNECGKWNPDAIERQLAHVENNDVRRAYTRGEHWDERVKMMQWWADHLDMLRIGADIVQFPGEARA
jgi:integrase